MNNLNKSHLYWYCRRGILELDIILISFLKKKYDSLNKKNKLLFIELLKYEDIELFNYILLKKKTSNSELDNLIKIIQFYACIT